MRLVFLGPPGAGKGTQAGAIRDRLGIPHISTGDMLRRVSASGTPTGLEAGAIIDGGGLAPDDLMAQMVRERLSAADASRGFLLDGYPRTLDQGVTLESILGEMGWKLDHVLYLALEDAEIVKRISGRRTCGACGAPYHIMESPSRPEATCAACGGALVQRPDDREDVVVRRLKVYRDSTQPLVEFYRRRGLLREIDATGSIKDVERRLAAAVPGPAPPGLGSRL